MSEDPFGWVGQLLDGKFAIEAVVGEGGFAVVYRGHHKGFDEKVAIKFLKIPRKMEGEERQRFLTSFLEEGRLLHRLSKTHAGIVQALDVGEATSPSGVWTPYLVLEWLEGETLETDLRRREKSGEGPRSLANALALLEPAARALTAAHAQGVAHRDVKPANLFLTQQAGRRTIKVLDFGIAKVISQSTDLLRAHEATGTSLQAFTPRYGAPEQFDRRFGATGPWTDVFALTLVLVEVVAGKSAMDGDTAQLFVAASNPQHRPTLRAHGVNEGDRVERVLERALAVSTKERYASAGELWDALTHAAGTSDTVLSVAASELDRDRLERLGASTRGGGTATSPPGSTERSALGQELPTRHPRPEELVVIEPPRAPATARPSRALDQVNAPARSSGGLVLALGAAMALGGAAFLVKGLGGSKGPPVATAAEPATGSTSSAAVLAPADAGVDAAPAVPPVPGFQRYVHPQAHFVVLVPDELGAMLPADAADTVLAATPSRDVHIRAWGGTLDARRLDAQYEEATRSPSLDVRWVSEKTRSPSGYSVATIEHDDRMVYEKAVTTTDRFATVRISFPKADAERWQARAQRVLNSLSFAAVSE